MNKNEYVKAYVLNFLLYGLWYKILLYRNIGFNFSNSVSIVILIFICIFFLLNSFILLPKTELMIHLNLISMFGIYTLLAYKCLREEICLKVIISVIIGCVLSVVLVFIKSNIAIRGRKTRWFFTRVAIGIIVVLSINTLVLMTNIVCIRISNNGSLVAKTVDATIEETELDTYIKDEDFIEMLRSDVKWEELSLSERADVLQVFANIERNKLKIPHKMNIVVADLEKGLAGKYNEDIYISMNCLNYDSKWSLINTVFHEAYHGYQKELVNIYLNNDLNNRELIKKAEYYREEFKNYISGKSDYNKYYNQHCEIDARRYAEDRVKEIYDIFCNDS